VPQQFVNFGEVLPHFVHLNIPPPPPTTVVRGCQAPPVGIQRLEQVPSQAESSEIPERPDSRVPTSLTRPCHLETRGDGSHRE